MVWPEKWFGPAIRKISAKNKRPSRTTGPAMAGACDREREDSAAVAIKFSPSGNVHSLATKRRGADGSRSLDRTRACTRQVANLCDGGRFRNLGLLSGLLVFGVDEGHVRETDKRQNVAEVRLLIVEAFSRRSRTECAAAGGHDVDLLAFQNALRAASGEENCLAHADDLIDPCLQGRRNGEVIHWSTNQNGVGLNQFLDEFVGELKDKFLLGSQGCGIGVHRMHPFIRDVRKSGGSQVPFDRGSVGMLLLPGFYKAAGQLPGDRVAASAGIDAK